MNSDLEQKLEKLAETHEGLKNPFEPFFGVMALFNADLHAYEPGYAPRDDWIVESAEKISHIPLGEDERV